jgi:hypothetical protein
MGPSLSPAETLLQKIARVGVSSGRQVAA